MPQKIKVKAFLEATNTGPELAGAVIWQFGGWSIFQKKAADVANHGIDGGYCGFDSYSATISFAKRNKQMIIFHAMQVADEIGESFTKVIAGFNCLKNSGITEKDIVAALMFPRSSSEHNMKLVYNALAWYAGETVAHEYVNYVYYLENED